MIPQPIECIPESEVPKRIRRQAILRIAMELLKRSEENWVRIAWESVADLKDPFKNLHTYANRSRMRIFVRRDGGYLYVRRKPITAEELVKLNRLALKNAESRKLAHVGGERLQ